MHRQTVKHQDRTCRAAPIQQKTLTITRHFSFKEDNFTRVCYHVYYICMELIEIQPYSHIRECLRLQEIIRPIPTSQSPIYLQTFCVSIHTMKQILVLGLLLCCFFISINAIPVSKKFTVQILSKKSILKQDTVSCRSGDCKSCLDSCDSCSQCGLCALCLGSSL